MSSNDIHDNYINIYKGRRYYKKRLKTAGRVVAFDLDETLGSFTDLDILWSALQDYTSSHVPVNFNMLLDLYPEFLRYGILPILEYLIEKKKTGECSHIYIYTNNQCGVGWVDLISSYFNYALKQKQSVFNQTIYAFKINNQRIEPRRTTHNKTYSDFILCTLLPKNTEIFFLDNSYYPDMKQTEIYYIQPKSYNHHLSTQDIIQRFVTSNLYLKLNPTSKNLSDYLLTAFIQSARYTNGNPNVKDLETDILVAQKLMYHLRDFFYISSMKNKTKKARARVGHLTRKRNTN
jgi:hypothetical protein